MLADAGRRVLILEARSRIGGRILTDQSVQPPVELGAMFIHGVTNNPIPPLLQRARMKRVDYDSIALYRPGGAALSEAALARIDRRLETLVDKLETERSSLLGPTNADIALGTAIDRALAGLRLSPSDRRDLDFAITMAIEHDYAAEVAELSYAGWYEGDDLGGGDAMVSGGFDDLPRVLSEGLRIVLGETVRRIETDAAGVRITGSRVFTAERVLVTLPLGVLRAGSVTFAPELPDSKRAAISRLRMGTYDKVVLEFAAPFWTKDSQWLGLIGKTKRDGVLLANLVPFDNTPRLIASLVGETARTLEQRSDDAAVGLVLDSLRAVYGKAVSTPVRSWVTRWAQDPYSLGSYSFVPVGASGSDLDVLAEPVGTRLFFAGEATSRRHAATVHGALLSGQREAERILDLS
jgi:monoamine oxidase